MEFTKDIQFNTVPTAEQELILNYSGFLSNSQELTLVYGFGESWNHTTEVPMTKTETGFSAQISLLDFDTLNFCFRNSKYEWDNNCSCNYISSILPCSSTKTETASKFDLDALIEEILQPILLKETEIDDNPTIQISTNPIDLGIEIRNILSNITPENANTEPLMEYSTLDEILTCTVIDETPVELLENNEQKENKQTALVNVEDPFTISPRKLSKFYWMRKRIKLSFYKLFVKLPKLIFGLEE